MTHPHTQTVCHRQNAGSLLLPARLLRDDERIKDCVVEEEEEEDEGEERRLEKRRSFMISSIKRTGKRSRAPSADSTQQNSTRILISDSSLRLSFSLLENRGCIR